jgi:hypothetical protein
MLYRLWGPSFHGRSSTCILCDTGPIGVTENTGNRLLHSLIDGPRTTSWLDGWHTALNCWRRKAEQESVRVMHWHWMVSRGPTLICTRTVSCCGWRILKAIAQDHIILEPVISFFRPILSYARKIRQQENVGPSGHSAGLPKMRMWAPLHVANRAFEATTEEQHLSLATRSVKSCLLRLGTDGWQSLPFYLILRFQRALAAVSPDPPFTFYRVKLSPGLGYSWS